MSNSQNAERNTNDANTAAGAVLIQSIPIDAATHPLVVGYDFNEGINYEKLMKSYATTGFQATNLARAVDEVNAMLAHKYNKNFVLPPDAGTHFGYPEERRKTGCTIFLGYTSNMISSGLRESIRFLAQHDMIDCIVTSAGGVEEDLIKCLAPTHVGSFELNGKELRMKGHNRIGNLLVPNGNYCAFEDWLMPILDACLAEQQSDVNVNWTPSKLIRRLGLEINNETSVCYWAAKNNIPIFCPSLTDGSLGDMLYFHTFRAPDLRGIRLDIVEDLRHLNCMAVRSIRTGVIILGGGMVKHHINNANLMRNGTEHAEFDGSDSGARPDEAVSWGKIRMDAKPAKVYADATLVFPLLVAQTFAKRVSEYVPPF